MLAGYQEGVSYVPSVKESLEAIRAWENMIRVWEGDEGEVVGAVTIEYPWPGTAFTENPEGHSSFLISGPPEPELPLGFFFRTMADRNDIELRREVFGRAFNHPDPRDWPSAFAYEELQRVADLARDGGEHSLLQALGLTRAQLAFMGLWRFAGTVIASLAPALAPIAGVALTYTEHPAPRLCSLS